MMEELRTVGHLERWPTLLIDFHEPGNSTKSGGKPSFPTWEIAKHARRPAVVIRLA